MIWFLSLVLNHEFSDIMQKVSQTRLHVCDLHLITYLKQLLSFFLVINIKGEGNMRTRPRFLGTRTVHKHSKPWRLAQLI
jgi:hypothetical protein